MKSFIIDEIQKKEKRERPRLQIPIEQHPQEIEVVEEKVERGVVVINFWGDENEDD